MSWPIQRRHLRRPPPACQTGSASIEFSLIAIPILLAGLGSIEIARWLFIKQAISLALLEAARAGATQHASPHAIASAFEKALAPLFPPTARQSSAQRVQSGLIGRETEIGLPGWQIEIIEPSAKTFRDFSDPTLPISRQTGLAAINNHYQMEQDRALRAKGRPNGLGPESGHTIYQANTLVLKATYLQTPLVPGVKGLIRALSRQTDGYASQAMARGGYLPITQKIAVTMQSHPVQWPTLTNRKVIPPASRPAALLPYRDTACHGLWCLRSPGAGAIDTDTRPVPGLDQAAPAGQDPQGTAGNSSGSGNPVDQPPANLPAQPPSAGLEPPTDDILCPIA